MFLNRGDAAFDVERRVWHEVLGPFCAHDAVPADLDGDGDLDVVPPHGSSSGGLYALYSDGNANFDVRPLYVYQQSLLEGGSGGPHQFGDVALGDFDGDGLPDVVIGDAWQGMDNILYTRDDGFEAGPSFQLDPVFTAGSTPEYDLRLDDFNKDGLRDILATGSRMKTYLILSMPAN